ncbi:MAG: magnesium/cobalt transporter CorA [Planctomycetes bacterium]|nr:magnesium/cobalt transporter CorA [Planctomycetota bacterium]
MSPGARPPRKRRIHKRVPPGSRPGTLIADPHGSAPVVRAFGWGPGGGEELVNASLEDLAALRQRHALVWVNVDGLGDAQVVRRLGEIFGLHPLALEDVLNTHQRAKVEDYPGQLFVVARMLQQGMPLSTDQLALFLGPGWVITFQEHAGDNFDPLRARLRSREPELCGRGADYLAYALIDAVVDGYFPVLEDLGERVEKLEEEALHRPVPLTLHGIHAMKGDLLLVRRAVWPMREAVHGLVRQERALITADTRLHLNDCYDHTVQVMDLAENYRDIASSLVEIYLSSISNRLNEVMKVLTIITTIFIPLSFIASVYGMNFRGMPELSWEYGYPATLVAMGLVALGLVFFFRRKGWMGRGARERAREQSEIDRL